jgi:Nucleotide modification associated domain 2
VGLGSKNSPIGDVSNRVVYAMKVTKVLSMRQYDEFCGRWLRTKIPDWTNSDFRRKMGDSIYDFDSGDEPHLRRSVHTDANRKKDLSGRNVLLSKYFYYFGDRPVPLPEVLLPLIHPTQGHKSRANDRYRKKFIKWLEDAGWKKNRLVGRPQLKDQIMSLTEEECRSSCSKHDREDDERVRTC